MNDQPDTNSDMNARQTAEQNLALIRSMMEAGRRRAGIDGAHLMIWGSLLMVAFFAQYLQVFGYIPGGMLAIWLPFTAIGWLLSYRTGLREQEQNASANPATAAYVAAWSAAGTTMLCYFGFSFATDTFDPRTITILTGAVFGSAFYVISKVTQLPKLLLVAAGWWAIMIYSVIIPDYNTEMLLVLAAASAVLILLPGQILRRFGQTETLDRTSSAED